jgi:forkhead box protein K
VRHNLSSGKAFVKIEKSTSDRGKGWFWGVSPEYEQEQQAKAAAAAAGPSDPVNSKKKKKELKKETGPLGSLFASTPLAFKSNSGSGTPPASTPPIPDALARMPSGLIDAPVASPYLHPANPVPRYPSIPSPAGPSFPAAANTLHPAVVPSAPPPPSVSPLSAAPAPAPATPAIDPALRVPITVGPLPASYCPPPTASGEVAKRPPMVLHENALILDPVVFGTLTPARLAALEAQGVTAALEALQLHLVAFLREKRGVGSKKRNKKKGQSLAGQPIASSVPADEGAAAGLVLQQPEGTEELIVVDDSGEEGPAAKKRRMAV